MTAKFSDALPCTVMTTKHGLLVIADKNNKDLFTYCPHFGVMRGLGDFDDNMELYTPRMLQLLNASDEDLGRMKKEWELASRKNTRFIGREEYATREDFEADAPLPFIPALEDPVFVEDLGDEGIAALDAFEEACVMAAQADEAVRQEELKSKPKRKAKAGAKSKTKAMTKTKKLKPSKSVAVTISEKTRGKQGICRG